MMRTRRARWALGIAIVAMACSTGVGAAPVFEGAVALLKSSAGLRFVIRETVEGSALARELIGHPIRGEGDFEALAQELGRPEHVRLLEDLAPRFEVLSRIEGETNLRTQARESLGFVAAGRAGFAGARDAFLAPGATRAPLMGQTMNQVKVAAVQYPVQGGRSYEELVAKIERFTREAYSSGAKLVVFPELVVLDRVDPKSAVSEAEQLARIARHETPRVFERIGALSRELGVSLLGGSFPRETSSGIVNTAILAFPDGRVVLQDKLNLTPDEARWGWKTGNELKVFDTPWGRSTILICYDSQFPAVSAALGEAAPELILVPSMTGAKGMQRVRWTSQARAVEHHAYVVVTGTVDAPGVAVPEYWGQAAFLTPQEEGFEGLQAQGPLNQGSVVFADLDLAQLRLSRKNTGLYAARDHLKRSDSIRIISSDHPQN